MATDGATASDNSNARPHDFTATSPKRFVMGVSMRRECDRLGEQVFGCLPAVGQ